MVTNIQSDGVYYISSDTDTDTDNSESSATTHFLPADLVVVNADLPYASKSLFENNNNDNDDDDPATPPGRSVFDWDDKFSFSSGVISFHWSVSKSLEDLNTHNVFMVGGSRSQAELSWKILRDNTGDVEEHTPFNFYVHRASKTDPTAAPPGCDSIMVLVPCRTLQRDPECARLSRREAMERYKEQFSEEMVAKARQAVFQRLAAIESLGDLESHILEEVVDTPATWADQFHLAAGSPFALVRTYG
jgi:phytoene desaturase (3,4-didehydrolycopene-forming)